MLYDGQPDPEGMWRFAKEAGVTCFGTSAGFVSACMKAGVEPGAGRDLSALKAIGSTGSPLSPEGFDWIYEHIGEDTWLFSTSGGTDLCTAFVGGVATLPVYRGEIQARALGAAVEAWNEEGEPVVGEVGELVVTEPMPSMPVHFWGDEDGGRERARLELAAVHRQRRHSAYERAADIGAAAGREEPDVAAQLVVDPLEPLGAERRAGASDRLQG